MTALWIILGIVLLLALILSVSATVRVSIEDKVKISVGALGIYFPIPLDGEESSKKKKKPKKAKKRAKKKPSPEVGGKPSAKPDEKSFGETVHFALLLLKSILPGVARLSTHVRLTGLRICLKVGCGDADKTALAYGRACAGIYTLLGALDNWMTLKIKNIDIYPDFVGGETEYHISFRAKLRLFHIVSAAIGIFYKLMVNTIKDRAEQSAPNRVNPSKISDKAVQQQ